MTKISKLIVLLWTLMCAVVIWNLHHDGQVHVLGSIMVFFVWSALVMPVSLVGLLFKRRA
jgi:hypothetical protein